jgi:hypothetical protein
VQSMSRTITLTLILILVAPFLVAQTVSAQVSKPVAPEFTVQFGDHSYDIPTTYTTDIYTGETITHQGYRVQNRSIDLIIKNQPFSQFGDGSGNVTGLYYNVRERGHFGSDSDWKNFPEYTSFPASSSSYTTISFSLNGYAMDNSNIIYAPAEGKLDFQVQALVGYYHTEWVSMNLPDHPLAGGMANVFHGQKSDWSNTQILEMANPTTQPSTPAPTVSPTEVPPTESMPTPPTSTPPLTTLIQPNTQLNAEFSLTWEQIALAVSAAVIAVLAVGLVALWRRLPKK